MKNIATTVMLLMFAYGLTGCKPTEQQVADDAAAMADAAGSGDTSEPSTEFDAGKEFSTGTGDEVEAAPAAATQQTAATLQNEFTLEVRASYINGDKDQAVYEFSMPDSNAKCYMYTTIALGCK